MFLLKDKTIIINFILCALVILILPAPSYGITLYEKCLLESFSSAAAERTVEELRNQCQQAVSDNENQVTKEISSEGESAMEKRFAVESLGQDLPFLLVPHNRNYVLPFSYNEAPDNKVLGQENSKLDNTEVKFQFSVKSRLAKGLFLGEGDLWFGYTNLSFWQAYNSESSSQFRETNHEPEVFVDFQPNLGLGDWKNNLIRIGASHQSNGRGSSHSRSWNRLYTLLLVEHNNWYFAVKPWYRIPEGNKQSPNDSAGDDNPDIYKFMGYGEFLAFYRKAKQSFGLTVRNNLRNDNRLGLQLDWSFPMTERLRGYVQYFNGYGESLIDYNDSVNRIGLGVLFSDVL